MQKQYQYGEETLTLTMEPEGEGFRVRLPDGTEQTFTARLLPDDVMQIATAGHTVRVPFARTERGIELFFAGQSYLFTPTTERRAGAKRGKASGSLAAPMVGVVAEVLVSAGQTVEAYQPLVTVEAMKVMATLEAPFAGTVTKLLATKGQRVAHGEILVEVQPVT